MQRCRRMFEKRICTRHQEHTGSSHCCRMDEGADRRRALHGIRQPDMQGELRGFTHRPGEDTYCRPCEDAASQHTADGGMVQVKFLAAEFQQALLIALGGAVRPGEQTLHGHLTDWGVAQFRADKLIYGIEAISLQHGLTHSQIVEVSTDRALASAATQTIILADHTKFGKVAPALVMPLEKVHVIVTDRELAADIVESLCAKGIQVILA